MSISEKLTAISENVKKVYEAGQRAGGGGDSTFWDAFQDKGNRTDYRYAFAYAWTDSAFKPKHNITPAGDGSRLMFYNTNITDIVGALAAGGVSLSTLNATNLYQAFESANITSIPDLDLSACTDMTLAFRYSKATSITINNVQANCKFDRTFNSCPALVNLTITGTIGYSGFNVTDCKNLSKASLINILNCLSAEGAGKTITLGSTNLAKLTDAEGVAAKNSATSKGWALA